jgi:hypothetical protein
MPCIGLAAPGGVSGRPAKSKKMVTIQKSERAAAPVQGQPNPRGALPACSAGAAKESREASPLFADKRC